MSHFAFLMDFRKTEVKVENSKNIIIAITTVGVSLATKLGQSVVLNAINFIFTCMYCVFVCR